MKLLCLDAEFAIQEILELSVWETAGWPATDGNRQAFHQYFRPERERSWPGSQRVHHISPKMVANKPPFRNWRPKIQQMMDEADFLVGFDLENDREVLSREGIERLEDKRVVDVKDLHWLLNTRRQGVELDSRRGLQATAEELGVEFSENLAHGADYDTRKTLECFHRLIEQFSEEEFQRKPSEIEAGKLLARYLQRWEEEREAYNRQYARGWVSLQQWKDGYRVKAGREQPRERDEIVAIIEVAARKRAMDEIDQHFDKRRDQRDSRVYNLREADIEWFRNYANEYDGQEPLHARMLKLRQQSTHR